MVTSTKLKTLVKRSYFFLQIAQILKACFLSESALCSFSLVTFWQKSTFVRKSARKMLMKFTPNGIKNDLYVG